ncbi:ATP-dependent DNA helicase RecG [Roseofilum sp. Belize Diploria]|uniref:ATP-dependent DNA helicase RecG n=1 Tax=Roseofilum sp. Belize Diploria TaxID=2821501 RepID=UPI001B1770C2|nr:ATP-dependent DNA helicase RecG [Roseofilum sp. Belize Diploria]MBP0011062.1 ATP-dependent DNA helicase RecG [Roseofilum sp. Belize Diploria]
MTQEPDWQRLQKALTVEQERGFNDLQGKQYRFSEFLQLSFANPPASFSPREKRQWKQLSEQFQTYPQFTFAQRQQLVAQARKFLSDSQKRFQQPPITPAPKPSPALHQQVPETTECDRASDAEHYRALTNLPEFSVYHTRQLAKLNLHTVRDLLFYYPRNHTDYASQVFIADLEPGETVTVVGEVKRINCFSSPRNKKLTILEIILKDATGQLKVSRFFAGAYFSHRGWQESQKRNYPVGSIVAASGLVKKNKYGLTLDKPELEVLESSGELDSLIIGQIVPIYPLTEGVAADTVRKAIWRVLPTAQQLTDPIPELILSPYSLIQLSQAIHQIHFPGDQENLEQARRRLIFDEFFYLQVGFLQRRHNQKKNQKAIPLMPTGQLIDRFYQGLPFALTGAQERVVNEILSDLRSPTAMNRLVQGDVGSGKTVVAVIAILAAIQSGYQAALMAPTEVLAEQHYRKLVTWFNRLHLPVELLTGSTKVKKRREIHAHLETGELPLLVGTHALIQEGVNFHRLGLVVIDEQHRFGVEQRALLQQKGESPHVLCLTATPIPRTLTLTMHGDLDVSQIDELPPGRQAIETLALTHKERKKVYELMRREIAQGRQAYVVFPLIEESDKLNAKAAIAEHKNLSETIFPEFQVGLLHGRMTSAEKDEALTAFRDNEIQIIVSTTVIEVGVDVPNATVMLIENAERFGLSQLHQLRGRVGRGSHKSYCLLLSSSNNPDARQRLNVLEQSQDGFFIAEMDLQFRGPGEVLGTRQSGLPDFALASLVQDQDILALAREAAENLIAEDPELGDYPLIREELQRRYEQLMGGAIMT